MGYQLGYKARLYRNTGNYGTPIWNVISQVKDVDVPKGAGEVDVSIRAGAYKLTAQGLRETGIEFDMVEDHADDDYLALMSAEDSGTAVEFAVLDGPIGTSGNCGWRMVCAIISAASEQHLDDAQRRKFSVKPTLETGNTHYDPSPVKSNNGALDVWAFA